MPGLFGLETLLPLSGCLFGKYSWLIWFAEGTNLIPGTHKCSKTGNISDLQFFHCFNGFMRQILTVNLSLLFFLSVSKVLTENGNVLHLMNSLGLVLYLVGSLYEHSFLMSFGCRLSFTISSFRTTSSALVSWLGGRLIPVYRFHVACLFFLTGRVFSHTLLLPFLSWTHSVWRILLVGDALKEILDLTRWLVWWDGFCVIQGFYKWNKVFEFRVKWNLTKLGGRPFNLGVDPLFRWISLMVWLRLKESSGGSIHRLVLIIDLRLLFLNWLKWIDDTISWFWIVGFSFFKSHSLYFRYGTASSNRLSIHGTTHILKYFRILMYLRTNASKFHLWIKSTN